MDEPTYEDMLKAEDDRAARAREQARRDTPPSPTLRGPSGAVWPL